MDEYRVAVVGPLNCGKSTVTSLLCRGFGGNDISRVQCSSNSDYLSSSSDAICVVVNSQMPLGINICSHSVFKEYSCVESFVCSPGGGICEIEATNRVRPGDILFAVDRTSLAKLNPVTVASILRNKAEDDTAAQLIISFVRPSHEMIVEEKRSQELTFVSEINRSDKENSPSSQSNLIGESETFTLAQHHSEIVAVDRPAGIYFNVLIFIADRHVVCVHRLLFAPIAQLECQPSSCLLEVVDFPGNDPDDAVLSAWIPLLDGLVLVYSADSVDSLVSLERRYARIISKRTAEELYNLPM
jgi:hypothetical protein